MRRATLLLPLLALGAGATALAQDQPSDRGAEPQVRSRQVFALPGGCRPGEQVTIRVNPSGTVLSSMRVHVAGLEVLRMTGVQGPATATVRIPTREATRVTATADTTGGQELYLSRVYGRCAPVAVPFPGERPVIGGGED
jgi:hypothetical protein